MNLAHELGGLERFGPVLDALPGPAYLVGGTVRDLLLDRPPRFDFDVTVVGDAEAFANELAAVLGGTVTTHERFGTAVVRYGDRAHVDVTTARTETYPDPGALPVVEPAVSIEDDLRRRDFTVNAMAISLRDGELVDPVGGRAHLEDRILRILHERSFEDDPTRIMRAARYEVRLDFRMDPKTETLALLAVPALAALTGARVREELYAVFEEDEAEDVLARLGQLGVEAPLRLKIPDPGLVAQLRELSERYRLGVARSHLGLLAVDAPVGRLDELKVPRRLVEGIEAAHREANVLRQRVSAAQTASAIVDEVERTGPDTPLYALALGDIPQLRAYFEQLREVRLELDGDDLAALGLVESPRVGEVLAELRRRKLNGGLTSRAAELAAARELIAE